MERHSSEPQDEIYNLSYVLMCSHNWIWNNVLSIQMVTGAASLKKCRSSNGRFHSAAVQLQRCGTLIEFSLPTCLVMAKFPFWNPNLPMLQTWSCEAVQVGAAPGRMFMYSEAFGPRKLNPFYLQLGSHVRVNLTICFSTSLSVYSCIFLSTVTCFSMSRT